ncbi:MAG: type II toxin-antitoxin system VapC family toxin, partial [Gammaproteobacteria bacterium]
MNGYLLDSHTFLWWLAEPDNLGKRAAKLLSKGDARLSLSIASIWEIALKMSVGKLKLEDNWLEQIEQQCIARSITMLPIQPRHCAALSKLPFHHRDPFDRMLASQASNEDLAIISADRIFD